MPIVPIDDSTLTFAGPPPLTRLADIQQRSSLASNLGIDPVSPPEAPPDPVSFWRTWQARAQTSFVQDVYDALTPRGPTDPDFNPYRFIRERPDLESDQRIRTLVTMGQFDDSRSEGQFDRDLELGLQYLDNLDILHRSGNVAAFTTFVGSMIGDPLNAVPMGLGAKMFNEGRLATQALRVAAAAGGVNIAIEELQNAVNPLTETPGASNEIAAGLMGGVLGGGTKFLFGGLGRALTETDQALLARRARAMIDDAMGTASAEAMRSGSRSPLAGTALTPEELFEADIAAGMCEATAMLTEEAADHATIRALHRPGDATATLLEQLRAKYASAGKSLTVLEHDNQRLLDLFDAAKAIDAEVNTLAPASAKDLEQTASPIIGAPAAALDRAQRFINPGGRLSTIADANARLAAAVRTLSASEQTITQASARNPAGHRAPVSAEALKDVFAGHHTTARNELYAAWREGKRSDAPMFGVEGRPVTTKREFMEAVGRIAAAEEDAANFPWLGQPATIHPALRKGVDAVRRYLQLMGDEAEAAGLPGSKSAALGEMQDTVQSIRDALKAATDPTEAAKLTARLTAAESALARVKAIADRRALYLPRLYQIEALLADPEDFIRRAAESFPLFDQVKDGKQLRPDDVPLIPHVVERLGPKEQAALREALAPLDPEAEVPPLNQLIADKTEGDIPDELRQVYRELRQDMYTEGGRNAHRSLTNPKERHGLAEGHTWTDPMSARVMDVAHNSMAPYLIYDVERLLDHYHKIAAGRIAVRRAIAMNPDLWAGKKLADGRPVTTGQDIVAHVQEGLQAQLEVARAVQVAKGGQEKLIAQLEATLARVTKDLTAGLNRLEGRSIFGDGPSNYFALANYAGQQLKRVTFMNTMGSAALNFLTDLAPASLMALTGARRFPTLMRNLAAGLKGASGRDLQNLGLWLEHESHVHSLTDLDAGDAAGIGTGRMLQATQAFDRTTRAGSDALTRAGAIRFFQNVNKRIAAAMLNDRVMVLSRRVANGQELRPYEAARLNKMGFDQATALAYHRLVYEHGVIVTPTRWETRTRPVRDAFSSFENYLADGHRHIIQANIQDWAMDATTAQGRANRELFDQIAAGFAAEVHRHLVVTPGAFDRPLINANILGSIVNQLQSFNNAIGNQRLRPMAQMPATHQLWLYSTYLAFGAIVDAIQLHLSGRRNFQETAEEWERNPVGMAYGAFAKTGLMGALQRAVGFADAAQLPFAPATLTGNNVSSTASSRIYAPGLMSTLGPSADYLQKWFDFTTGRVATGNFPEGSTYRALKLTPFQNLIWLRLLHDTTDLPVIPEAYKPTR